MDVTTVIMACASPQREMKEYRLSLEKNKQAVVSCWAMKASFNTYCISRVKGVLSTPHVLTAARCMIVSKGEVPNCAKAKSVTLQLQKKTRKTINRYLPASIVPAHPRPCLCRLCHSASSISTQSRNPASIKDYCCKCFLPCPLKASRVTAPLLGE